MKNTSKLAYAILEFVFGVPPLIYLFHYDWLIGLCATMLVFATNVRMNYKLEGRKE